MKFTSKMTDTDIAKGIVDIGTRSASIRVDLQHLIVSITRNWAESGAVNVCATRMTELLNEMDTAHQQKLVNWCAVHCQFELMEDDDGNNGFVYSSDHTKMTKDEWTAAKNENMFVLTPDKKISAVTTRLDIGRAIAATLKRATSTDSNEKDDVDVGLADAVQDAMQNYLAAKG